MNRATIRALEPRRDPHQGALALILRPEDRHDLPREHAQRHILKHQKRPPTTIKTLPHPIQNQHRLRHHQPPHRATYSLTKDSRWEVEAHPRSTEWTQAVRLEVAQEELHRGIYCGGCAGPANERLSTHIAPCEPSNSVASAPLLR